MPDSPGEPLPVARARTLITAALPQPIHEDVPSVAAAGRIVAEAILAGADVPACHQAARNGYAVWAADTAGAGNYTPVSLALGKSSGGTDLPPGAAVAVTSGDSLPAGADAVLPLDAATVVAGAVEVLAAVPPWSGVAPRGSELSRTGRIACPGRRLLPQHVGLLVALGVPSVRVLRRPRVGVIAVGAKWGAADALTPLLTALLARDGACATCRVARCDRAALGEAIADAAAADLLIVAGGSGDGPDDQAVPTLAEMRAEAIFHGVNLRPGGTTGLWRVGGVPVLLLPGTPLACMIAYDVLASLPLRRVDEAYATGDAVLERKIVSRIGCMDAVRVALSGARAAPLGDAEAGGLASLARADGFVLVPEASEGFAPEAPVRVHLYGSPRQVPA